MPPFRNMLTRVKNYLFPAAAAEREFKVTPAVSDTMERNINLWYAMYVNDPPWKTPAVVPLGLPAAICREVARPTMAEYTGTITGGARATFLDECFQAAAVKFMPQVELGLAVGGIAFKPYIYGDKLLIDATSATAFQPTAFDAAGRCTGGVFREKAKVDGRYYVRMEYHNLEGDTYTVQNKAYNSDSSGAVRDTVPLATVPQWADIKEEVVLGGIGRPLFVYFQNPQNNNVEADSRAGMSIYGGSIVDLVRRADEQWDLIRWEYESGQRKIIMDGTSTTANQFDKRLYEIGPFSRSGEFYEVFSPEFRDEPLYRGLQAILKQIEFQVGLSYGTLSDPQSVEKTATEVRNSKQRMFITINALQKALEQTFDDLIYAMDAFATLYQLAPAGEYTVTHDWGDSILDDVDTQDKEFARDLQLLSAGILNDWEVRAKWMGEDEATAKAALPGMEEMTTEPEAEIE